jgi:hypothetical protein
VIPDRGGDKDDLDIRCVWSRGTVLDVIVFRRREQRWIVCSEEGDRFSDIAREETCSKDRVLCKRFQELESTGQVIWFPVVDGNAELVFETQGEHRVVAEIGAYAGGINEDGNVVFLEDGSRTDTGEHEDLGSVNCSAANDDFLARPRTEAGSMLFLVGELDGDGTWGT